jgi:hypothetical protein
MEDIAKMSMGSDSCIEVVTVTRDGLSGSWLVFFGPTGRTFTETAGEAGREVAPHPIHYGEVQATSLGAELTVGLPRQKSLGCDVYCYLPSPPQNF